MGLDQYAFARKEGQEDIEIAYWRKHADLQGWMENLYHSRGGKRQFNCIDLKLKECDLNRLEKGHRDLSIAEGFFWGSSNSNKVEATARFIEEARERMKEGYTIIYSSWW